MPDETPTPQHDPSPTEPAGPAGREAQGGRGWRIAAVVSVIAALIAAGVLASLLFADGGSGSQGEGGPVEACIPDRDQSDDDGAGSTCPPKGAKSMDGLVEKTSKGGFTIRTIVDGNLAGTVKLHVREPDRPYIDIAHAQTHAALGQPIRVYTRQIDGQESVVYMEDAPLLE